MTSRLFWLFLHICPILCSQCCAFSWEEVNTQNNKFLEGDPDVISSNLKAPEICSCGMKILINGTDTYFLKSPNFTMDPCFWKFYAQPGVSVEINCFLYELRGIQRSRTECQTKGDSFTITVDGVTEAHCNPFHHFSKYVDHSTKNGFMIQLNYKRGQTIERVGQSFECSIIGSWNNYNGTGHTPNERLNNEYSECGAVVNPLERIIGGRIVSPNQYPWMVPLNVQGMNLCGGSIVSDRFILTAAHCLEDVKWVRVYFGVHKYGVYDEAQTSQEFFLHPEYSFPDHDIGLIRLPRKIVYSKNVRRICLPKKTIDAHVKVKGFGWGKTSDAAAEGSRYLKENTFTTISDERCRSRYGGFMFGKDVICTEDDKGESICQGDSGSTLGKIEPEDGRFYIYGISSFTSNTCEDGYPTGFTEVYPHLKWIEDNINKVDREPKFIKTFDVLDHLP